MKARAAARRWRSPTPSTILGAELDTSSSSDASYVDLHVPVARLGDALPVMADVIAHPTFPDAELKRLREEALTALLEAEDDPAQLIQIAFPRLVYGTIAPLRDAVDRNGNVAAQFHARGSCGVSRVSVSPANATLVVTGDVTANTVVQMLERTIGQWKGSPAAAASPALTDAPQLTARQIYLIDKPGAAQSQIRIGWVGVARSTPDYFPLRVLNTILGGAFTSRLNQNLREQHGYAYGASSAFDMRRAAGPFFAAAGVQTDKTADALKEFFNELTRIHELVGAEELEKAKNYLSLLLPRNFETTRATANALAQIAVYDLPQDFYEAYGQHVRAVTTADVKRVADSTLSRRNLLSSSSATGKSSGLASVP